MLGTMLGYSFANTTYTDSNYISVDPEIGSALVDACGFPEFGMLLLSTAQKFAKVEEVFAYCIVNNTSPEMVAACSSLGDYEERAEHYIHRFYAQDPLIYIHSNTAEETGFTACIHSNQIIPYDYREKCFEQPRFEEKLCFGWRGKKVSRVITFYRKDSDEATSIHKLATLANIGLSAMANKDFKKMRKNDNFIEFLSKRLQHVYPMFTDRENQICAYSIAGYTALDIAQKLGIKSTTVLTYKQRAYQRVGASNINDLLPDLMQ